ncbi:MAG: FAD binding domain-containing protein [bacterium]
MNNSANLCVKIPKSINELDEIALNSKEKFEFISGCTDLMVQNAKWDTLNNLIDLTSVKEMFSTIKIDGNYIIIGAAVPLTEIINSEIIKNNIPILSKCCSMIGSVQIQNRGTIGGNIGNASPAGDSLPSLNALDAELLIGPKINDSFKVVKLADFFVGFKKSILQENQYIAFIRIPITKNKPDYWYFRKVGQRYSMAISKVSLAMLVWKENNCIKDIRISTGSINAVIKRETNSENLLKNNLLNEEIINQAVEEIKNEVSPITDIRSNNIYRKHIAGELLKEALFLAIKE